MHHRIQERRRATMDTLIKNLCDSRSSLLNDISDIQNKLSIVPEYSNDISRKKINDSLEIFRWTIMSVDPLDIERWSAMTPVLNAMLKLMRQIEYAAKMGIIHLSIK